MMDETERVTKLLETTPPSCLAGFRLAPAELPIEWDDSIRSVWRLACKCGSEHGKVLGYPLDDFKPASQNGPTSFLSPIGFQCAACGRVTEVIDTDVHGYNSEVSKREGAKGSTKLRGEGPRVAWPCPQCQGVLFTLTVAFIYWDATLDLAADEPTWPSQDFFTVFLLFARCASCSHLSQPTEFGDL